MIHIIKGSKDLEKDITMWTTRQNWELITQYNFGGYAKISEELIQFILAHKHIETLSN